jgi:hypothetical protein
MLRLGCNLLLGALGHTVAARAETSTCCICRVTLYSRHPLVECRVYYAARRSAIAQWDVNPMPATALAGNGPDARRYRDEEAIAGDVAAPFQHTRAQPTGARAAVSGDNLRSAVGTAVYPALMHFAEFAYRLRGAWH